MACWCSFYIIVWCILRSCSWGVQKHIFWITTIQPIWQFPRSFFWSCIRYLVLILVFASPGVFAQTCITRFSLDMEILWNICTMAVCTNYKLSKVCFSKENVQLLGEEWSKPSSTFQCVCDTYADLMDF